MPYHSALPLFLLGIVRAAFSATYSGNCQYALNVTNDGPVTLDVPVTISAQLECADHQAEYLYIFEDDARRTIQIVSHDKASATFIYTDYMGFRTVQVTTYLFTHPLFLVASGKTVFRIEEFIPGTLDISGIIERKGSRKFLKSGVNTNITVHLQYPEQVLRDAEFAYSWNIEDEHFTTENSNTVQHRFTKAGSQWIRVTVAGRIPSYTNKNMFRYKWGYFDAEVTIKDPIFNISINGNTYLEHGQLLDLDITCNGSGPVEYCWKVLPPNENYTNLTCSDLDTATDCAFPILYYFRDSGDYLLAIHVNNLVTSLQRDVEVHIYDVSLRPELSTVIIPVVCSVLVVLIIATAIVWHMRRHSNYDIETADFDFLQTDESSAVALETSWQIMRRSLLQLIHLRCLCYAVDRGAPSVNYGSILVGVER
ncbi:Transmembrane protein 130 like protein [Argiope bruennichi]|uniref:Transmembrane protein 130 like protein n=1 Tax=Argiope bruennichi TaxID=94029 RepID=A0A8T0E3V8_ARGBR|nr:Transmembrane protein 130 like protein [Argiope bruennichi]